MISLKFYLYLLMFFLAGNISGQQQTLTNSLGMEFILIPPGKMVVGRYQPTVPDYQPPQENLNSPTRKVLPESAYKVAQKMAEEAYMPGFTVTIENPYYLGKFEVTQEQWEKVMEKNPSFFQGKEVKGHSGSHPVENITWQDAQQFIRRLNRQDKEYKYRLPTEFEWEYAARAGARDDIPWPEARAMAVISLWTLHSMVVWAAVYLTWGLGLAPDWRSYRTALAATAAWAVSVFLFNLVADTNYGYLNAKPSSASILDLLGDWPWYVLNAVVLVTVAWALVTWPWTARSRPRPSASNAVDGGHDSQPAQPGTSSD